MTVPPGAEASGAAGTNSGPNSFRPGPAGDQPPAREFKVQWSFDWLHANWPRVIEHLTATGMGAVAGVLRPAQPVAVDESSIRLGYPADQAIMRGRATGPMAGAIGQALEKLAAHPVKFTTEIVGQATGRPAVVGGQFVGGISSEQRRQVEQDPAVKTVTDLFGGQISSIRPDLELAGSTSGGDNNTNAAGASEDAPQEMNGDL